MKGSLPMADGCEWCIGCYQIRFIAEMDWSEDGTKRLCAQCQGVPVETRPPRSEWRKRADGHAEWVRPTYENTNVEGLTPPERPAYVRT